MTYAAGYPLPSIFITPRRRAELAAERADAAATAVYEQLRSDLHHGLMNDPQAVIAVPSFKMSASDVFIDDLAGTDSDARRHILLRILGDAAKGEDVQARVALMFADLARRHAEFHLGDALMGEDF